MKQIAINILKEKGLKVTENRIDILTVFLAEPKSFSLLDLEILYGKKHDRSSIYRFLQTCTEYFIIEKFIDKNGVALYVYNESTEINSNAHYQCKDCKTVVNLPELPTEYLQLLGANSIESSQVLLEGTCEKCQKN